MSDGLLFAMRGECLLCWYWWNCWPILLKVSFHSNKPNPIRQTRW